MTNDRSNELKAALQARLEGSQFPGVDVSRAWALISEVLEGQVVELFYAGLLPEGGYSEIPRPALQVVVCTSALVYECDFSASTMRYDVSSIMNVYRLTETWNEEQSVEGPPRKKLSVKVDFVNYQLGLSLQLAAYGDEAEELHVFARALCGLTVARAK